MSKKSKLLLGAVVATALMSSHSHADFIGVYAGATIWNADLSGTVQDGGEEIDFESVLGTDSDTATQFYVAFEHPVPFIPNIRVQHSDLGFSGNSTITSNFTFNGETFSQNTNVNSDVDLTHTDGTLYWELWDTIAGIDLGLTARHFSGSVLINTDDQSVSTEEDLSVTIPMLYARVGAKIPGTGITADVRANLIDISDNSIIDTTFRLNYEATFGLGVEAGYRVMSVDVDEDFIIDTDINGVFAGLSYHF